MIVLDTNVLSEPLRANPDDRVLTWLAENDGAVITAISVGELFTGIGRLPHGARRDALTSGVERALEHATVLPFDQQSARIYGQLQSSRRAIGRPLSVEDGMIAAICIANEASLATRNVNDFEELGLTVVNPWAG